MKKKTKTTSWTVFTISAVLCWLVFLLLFLTGCTLHFKGEKLEIETRPPEAKLGQNQKSESILQLTQLDLFNNQNIHP